MDGPEQGCQGLDAQTAEHLAGQTSNLVCQVNEFGTPQPPTIGQEELPALVQNECVTITPAVLHPGTLRGRS